MADAGVVALRKNCYLSCLALPAVLRKRDSAMRALRVLMVINHFHPIVGGAERQARKLTKRLKERGVEVSVLTSRHRGLSREEIVDGIPVRRHRVFHLRLGRRKILYTVSYVLSALLYLIRHRKSFDVLHAHQGFYPAFVCSFAARLLGKRAIVKIGNSGHRFDLTLLRRKPLIGRFMVRSMCKNMSRFVAISTHIAEELERFGISRESIVMIPNGVDVSERTKEVALPPGGGRDGFSSCGDRPKLVAGYVGTLSRHKNLETVIQAWAGLPPDLRRDCRLLIVGDGPERGRLEALANELGLANCLSFCGHQSDVDACFEQMDCYVSTSFVEGLSNSLLEAMAHRKACVVSDGVSGNVDVIQDGRNGFLVNPIDTKGVAEVIAALARDREKARRIGEKALSTVAEKYAISDIADKYVDLYRSILEAPFPSYRRPVATRAIACRQVESEQEYRSAPSVSCCVDGRVQDQRSRKTGQAHALRIWKSRPSCADPI